MAESKEALNAYNDYGFNSQIHRLDDTYASGMDRNRWQQTIGESDKISQLAKLKLGFNRSEGGFRSSFANRGLRNSGLFAQGLGQRSQDYNNANADIWRNWGLHKFSLASEAQNLGRSRNTGAFDATVQKQLQRNLVASSITS